jgi:sec-independent protein translocase protein TatA
MRIFGIGVQELLVILLICLLIFGADKLPEIGKSIGKTIREFKKSLKDAGVSDDEEKKQ